MANGDDQMRVVWRKKKGSQKQRGTKILDDGYYTINQPE